MKRSAEIGWLLVLFLFFVIPSVSWFFLKENVGNENGENRTLSDKPILSFSDIKNYPSEYEKYYNDNLPYRDFLIQCDSIFNFFLFHESSVEAVIIGKENWLFYDSRKKSDGDTLADLYGDNLFTQEELQTICDNLSKAKDSLNAEGIQFVLFIAPNKERVYQSYLPRQYQAAHRNCGGRLSEN